MTSYIKYLVLITALLCPTVSSGQELGEVYSTRYTSVRYGGADDFNVFEKNLKGGMGIFFKAHGPGSSYMAEEIDGLFEKVEFLLDMFPKGLNIRVELYGNRSDLEKAYRGLGVKGKVPDAYYHRKNRTIYINAEDVSYGMLAHEFAHAIISAYFNNAVPEKTQEILAQYVDEQIRNSY